MRHLRIQTYFRLTVRLQFAAVLMTFCDLFLYTQERIWNTHNKNYIKLQNGNYLLYTKAYVHIYTIYVYILHIFMSVHV